MECAYDGCTKTATRKGLCLGHYTQDYRGQELRPLSRGRRSKRGYTHGTASMYSNHLCRCEPCRVAWNEYCNTAKKSRSERENLVHGSYNTYTNYGCRCDLCKEAGRSYSQSYTQAKSIYRKRLAAGEVPPPGESCECCGKVGMVQWDHDHRTGEHRGYLCIGCNTAIGKLGDTLEGVQRAVDYLSRRV